MRFRIFSTLLALLFFFVAQSAWPAEESPLDTIPKRTLSMITVCGRPSYATSHGLVDEKALEKACATHTAGYEVRIGVFSRLDAESVVKKAIQGSKKVSGQRIKARALITIKTSFGEEFRIFVMENGEIRAGNQHILPADPRWLDELFRIVCDSFG